VVGFSLSALSAAAPDRVAAALARVLRMLADHTLSVTPTTVGSLEGVPDVHDLLATGRGTGKYVVSVKRSSSRAQAVPTGTAR
jgi:NADPH2:quinone reductase